MNEQQRYKDHHIMHDIAMQQQQHQQHKDVIANAEQQRCASTSRCPKWLDACEALFGKLVDSGPTLLSGGRRRVLLCDELGRRGFSAATLFKSLDPVKFNVNIQMLGSEVRDDDENESSGFRMSVYYRTIGGGEQNAFQKVFATKVVAYDRAAMKEFIHERILERYGKHCSACFQLVVGKDRIRHDLAYVMAMEKKKWVGIVKLVEETPAPGQVSFIMTFVVRTYEGCCKEFYGCDMYGNDGEEKPKWVCVKSAYSKMMANMMPLEIACSEMGKFLYGLPAALEEGRWGEKILEDECDDADIVMAATSSSEKEEEEDDMMMMMEAVDSEEEDASDGDDSNKDMGMMLGSQLLLDDGGSKSRRACCFCRNCSKMIF
jgi:hypothetical protein